MLNINPAYLAGMQARVYKSTGSWYQVKTSDGKMLAARIVGKLKLDNITSTNPVAVGDIVNIENTEDATSTVITEILPRRNYINRTSPHNKNQHHIVASNLDQSLLFATLKNPKTSFGFLDRFLVVSEAYHIPAIIVFNKTDMHGRKEEEKFNLAQKIYEPLGYVVMPMSIEKKEGVNEVLNMLEGKTTLLSGHSGVGKSTFINQVFPGMEIRTKEVSGWSGKGMHTTTFAEMFDLSGSGAVIDTPGIREMGLVNIKKQELSHYFPEMRSRVNDCQFNNCIHVQEPGCAVKDAVGTGEIHEERYISYLNMLETLAGESY
ncbi:MAG: ribosome small subunit-dependent GTPase A [Ferruginibacter sp.]